MHMHAHICEYMRTPVTRYTVVSDRWQQQPTNQPATHTVKRYTSTIKIHTRHASEECEKAFLLKQRKEVFQYKFNITLRVLCVCSCAIFFFSLLVYRHSLLCVNSRARHVHHVSSEMFRTDLWWTNLTRNFFLFLVLCFTLACVP